MNSSGLDLCRTTWFADSYVILTSWRRWSKSSSRSSYLKLYCIESLSMVAVWCNLKFLAALSLRMPTSSEIGPKGVPHTGVCGKLSSHRCVTTVILLVKLVVVCTAFSLTNVAQRLLELFEGAGLRCASALSKPFQLSHNFEVPRSDFMIRWLNAQKNFIKFWAWICILKVEYFKCFAGLQWERARGKGEI